MSGKAVHISRKISNVRVQVERAIGRLRKLIILQSNILITQIKLLNDVMIITAGLVNLNNSAVSKQLPKMIQHQCCDHNIDIVLFW